MRRRSTPTAFLRSLPLAVVLLAGAANPQVPGGAGQEPDQLVESFRQRAAQLPFVDVGDLGFGKEPRRSILPDLDPARRAAFDAALRLLPWPDRLAALLADGEPKVRLLAAYALFRTADATHLPHLGALIGDDGAVPAMPRFAIAVGPDGQTYPKVTVDDLVATTVGAEARNWLAVWDAPPADSDAFAPWCARQQELAPTAACLRLKMLLATGGALSTRSWTVQDLFDVLMAARSAPRGAREVAEIALFEDRYQALECLYPDLEAHLAFAARRLGSENVLRMLRGAAPVLDGEPLAAESIAGLADGFARFVLERPARCGLRPEDVDELLELGRTTYRVASFRAAARLRPADAQEILREGLARSAPPLLSVENAACAILLWEMEPERSADFLAEWFHTDPERPTLIASSRRRAFALHLLRENGPAEREMFVQLVTDPRFELTEPTALQAIVQELEMTTVEPIVPRNEMLNFGHPLGLDRAFQDLGAAAELYPAQTGQMLRRMMAWHDAIRAHVADW